MKKEKKKLKNNSRGCEDGRPPDNKIELKKKKPVVPDHLAFYGSDS
jgi:hypothetical protein